MNGFTLIETIVTIGIMSVLAAILAVGWPAVREHQALLLTQQQLQSLFRQAQEQALNKSKPAECGSSGRCAHIGVAVQGNKARLFADTVGEDNSTDGAHVYDEGQAGDYVISDVELSAQVTTTQPGWQSFVFVSSPPTVELYGPVLGKNVLLGSGQESSLTIRSGKTERVLTILAHGQIE